MCGAAACDPASRPDTLNTEGGLLDLPNNPGDGSRSDASDGATADRGDSALDSTTADVSPDGAVDGGADVARDTQTDVATDAGMDAGTDAATDVGPTDVGPTDTPPDNPCAAPSLFCMGACVPQNVLNCGGCDVRCTPGANAMTTCTDGRCGLTCSANFADCNGMAGDGCEVETRSDIMHCGGCSTVCAARPHARPVCAEGTCRSTCETNFFDCNAMATDGCEVDGSADLDNCGGCGNLCRVTHGTSACTMGVCRINCEPGYYAVDRACLPIPAPRLLSPQSGSMLTSRRPLFEVAASGATNGVLIEICQDRPCRTIVATIQFTSGTLGGSVSVTPSSDLPSGVLFWRGHGVINRTNVGLDASATWELTIPERSAPIASDWGASIDPNGDGFNDVLIGTRDANGAYVYAGGATGLATTASTTLSSSSAAGFGRVVAAAGDVNGDGFPDVAIGAPAATQVLVFQGSASGLSTTAATTLPGAMGSGFGSAVASAGDINADGYSDLLVGAPEGNTVSVFTGSMGGLLSVGPAVLRAPTGATRYGQSVAGPGDLDGDGRPDVLVGAADAAWLHMGVPGSSSTGGLTLSPTALQIPTPSGAMGFGTSVAGAGDVNGDGYLDVIIGAPGSAAAYLFLGGARGLALVPSATLNGTAGSSFGVTVASAGDVNLDGFGDVLVGERSGSPAVIFLGTSTGLSTMAFGRIAAPAGAGASTVEVAAAGDLNHDRRTDFLVGDPAGASVAYYYTTATALASSPSGTLSSSPGSGFGSALAGAWR